MERGTKHIAVGNLLNMLKRNHIANLRFNGLSMTKTQAKAIITRNFKEHQKVVIQFNIMKPGSFGYLIIEGFPMMKASDLDYMGGLK